jgi:flagellin-like protein
MKGISTIIATILLLIITIALAGTAYVFISGVLTGKISKTISIMGASCNATNHITLVISNDGTDVIREDDIRIFIGTTYVGTFGKVIPPKESNVTSDIQGSSGLNQIRAVSPSNSVEYPVWCKG